MAKVYLYPTLPITNFPYLDNKRYAEELQFNVVIFAKPARQLQIEWMWQGKEKHIYVRTTQNFRVIIEHRERRWIMLTTVDVYSPL